jgi:hypothetical protein
LASILVLGGALLLAATSSDHATYTRADVGRAFRAEGIILDDLHLLGTGGPNTKEALLTPRSEKPFTVYLAISDRVAEKQYRSYALLGGRELVARMVLRGNVLVVHENVPTSQDRQRVEAAMNALAEG